LKDREDFLASKQGAISATQKSNEAESDEIESALISQAVEIDLCEKMIGKMEKDFGELLLKRQSRLEQLLSQEAVLYNEFHTYLTSTCISLEKLCLYAIYGHAFHLRSS
jgi:hypothetical protein